MALSKGVNSWATTAEGDIYFADRLDVGAWTDANDTLKSQAMVTASALIEQMDFQDPTTAILMPIVPPQIVKACFELAYHLLNNDGILDDSGRVVSLNVSSISLQRIIPPSLIPFMVKRILRPLLLNGGARIWFRNN